MSRQITHHFSEDELRCKCGCNQMKFTDAAVQRLEELRMDLGAPIHINSGYRCPKHNANISSTGLSGPHTITENDNITVDIKVLGISAHSILKCIGLHDFTGIGIRQKGSHIGRFIHLDCILPGGKAPRPWVWSY